MAYTIGDTITDAEYNGFVNRLNNLWGTGTFGTQLGYGQTGTVLSTVTAGNTVTATQWTTLLARMQEIANHQGNTITAITDPTAGTAIAVLSALEANIADLELDANKFSVAAPGVSTITSVSAQSAAWRVETTNTRRITFTNATLMRYFFNAGGKITVATAISGGTADGKYNEWADLANTLVGTYEITAIHALDVGGTGTPTTENDQGFYDLIVTPTVNFNQLADTAPYTANHIQITTHVDSVTVPTYLEIKTEYLDAHTNVAEDIGHSISGSNLTLGLMDGTVTTTYTVIEPALTYLDGVSWGTPVWSTIGVDTQT